MKSNDYDVVRLYIKVENEIIPIQAIVIDSLPNNICMTGRTKLVNKLIADGYNLADNDTDQNSLSISLLIGADNYSKFVYSNTVDDVTIIPSKFGSLLAGPINNISLDFADKVTVENVTVLKIGTQDTLDNQLQRFWNIEPDYENNIDNLDNFKSCVRFQNDHFIANLPWKNNHPELPINYHNSKRRLNSLLKSLRKTPDLLDQYDQVIKDQFLNKFIEKVDTNKSHDKLHYIPHHCVLKKNSTTPVRVVFDCSSKCKPDLPSLNDCLYSGPPLLNEMITILLRFRLFEFACVSDIMKAFLMVELEEEDRDVTRFLWPENPSDINSKIIVYRFRVVLFGATCSQFLLNMSIKVHLEQYDNPLVRDLEQSLYVDNVLLSVDNVEKLIDFYHNSNSVLNKANFKLRSWISNCDALNAIIPENLKYKDKNNDNKIDTLGLSWNYKSDNLSLKCHVIDDLDVCINRRFILSECSKIYDPLGMLLPVTISSQILIQDLWKSKSGWDDPLEETLLLRWKSLVHELNASQIVNFPRALNLRDVEICCFSDASMRAYGSVIYVRCNNNVNFFIAKAKVAPVKTVSLPHLELLGAHTAAKLTKYTVDSIKQLCNVVSINIWTDSQIVLSWLNATQFNKQYVQKRIGNIKTLVPNAVWNFVPGEQNPADFLTRGISARNFLNNKIWFEGPEWLKCKFNWPAQFINSNCNNNVEKIDVNVHKVIDDTIILEKRKFIENYIQRFDKYVKLVETTAFIFRFIDRLKGKVVNTDLCLSPDEYFLAEHKIFKLVQEVHLSDVISTLNSKSNCKTGKAGNIIKQLHLFIENSIVKCRGRLSNSILSYSAKFPIYIPNNSFLCVLLIREFHITTKHGGVSIVLSALREFYWIARGRQKVKSVLRKCVICTRQHGRVQSAPDVSPYPEFRVENNFPFTYTGVDYAGPLKVKSFDNSVIKVYICLFTCMTTRAVHLELAEDLTGECFIRAFRRFVSRRSCPSVMLSDNAGNFKYGSNYLYDLSQFCNVRDSLCKLKVDWKFIPSKAPHFGGVWERIIGLTKNCLRKVLGTKMITFVDLNTLLCEIEGQLNNRPITYVSDNIDEPTLTPSHLLYGRILPNIAMRDLDLDELKDPSYFSKGDKISKHCKTLSLLLHHFWTQWKEEYLKSLRERDRNLIGKEVNMPVGSIVLISDDNPRSMWRLGKIIELFKSKDGNVRSCKLKTSSGIITRPVVKLVNLEILSNECIDNVDNFKTDSLISRPPKRLAAIQAKENISKQC